MHLYTREFTLRRKTNGIEALGNVLYNVGVSHRYASMVLAYFGGTSYEAIRNWYGR